MTKNDKSVDDGGPAFPESNSMGVMQHGMSLRDWFAGQALAGLMANSDCDHGAIRDSDESRKTLAETMFALADAMLRARKEPRS